MSQVNLGGNHKAASKTAPHCTHSALLSHSWGENILLEPLLRRNWMPRVLLMSLVALSWKLVRSVSWFWWRSMCIYLFWQPYESVIQKHAALKVSYTTVTPAQWCFYNVTQWSSMYSSKMVTSAADSEKEPRITEFLFFFLQQWLFWSII